jgi:YafQ family addiction module toxin component
MTENPESDAKTDFKENHHFSPEYQAELNNIREEVKKGHCHDLKECIELFQELWHERHDYELLLSSPARKKLEKLSQKNPDQYAHVQKKVEQILKNPEHYKPLSGEMRGSRRVHVGDYVLIYQMEDNRVIIHDYDHHDHVYEIKN